LLVASRRVASSGLESIERCFDDLPIVGDAQKPAREAMLREREQSPTDAVRIVRLAWHDFHLVPSVINRVSLYQA